MEKADKKYIVEINGKPIRYKDGRAYLYDLQDAKETVRWINHPRIVSEGRHAEMKEAE